MALEFPIELEFRTSYSTQTHAIIDHYFETNNGDGVFRNKRVSVLFSKTYSQASSLRTGSQLEEQAQRFTPNFAVLASPTGSLFAD